MDVAIPSRNGIPLFGFGTFPLKGDEVARALTMALETGVRHIDTAQMYGNEADVGRAIRRGGVPRDQLFVVTKVDPGNIPEARFLSSVERSMEVLGGPADLLLIHWPPAEAEFEAALDRLMDAQEMGLTHAIGISNSTPNMMRRAQKRTGGLIVNNQVEFHPLLDQQKLLAAANDLGIVVSAYSPLCRGAALKPDVIQKVARRIGRPPSEVVLRWIIQQGVAAIPMTTKRDNALSNLNALKFELSVEDMAAITALGTSQGRLINPGWMAGRWEE
jgi:2,5-diketo-D-gluconate reductase B